LFGWSTSVDHPLERRTSEQNVNRTQGGAEQETDNMKKLKRPDEVRKGYRVLPGHRNSEGDWQPSTVKAVQFVQDEGGRWWNRNDTRIKASDGGRCLQVPEQRGMRRVVGGNFTCDEVDNKMSTTKVQAINKAMKRIVIKRRELESKITDLNQQAADLQRSTNRPLGCRWVNGLLVSK
jgi:hypothetical protein